MRTNAWSAARTRVFFGVGPSKVAATILTSEAPSISPVAATSLRKSSPEESLPNAVTSVTSTPSRASSVATSPAPPAR
jgi:hypothetical protein